MPENKQSVSIPILVDDAYKRVEDFPGKIPECPTGGCGFKCCKFESGNYIVMYPGELEEEMAKGLNADHLEVIEEDYIMKGGKKVVCKRLCTAEYVKPLDCKTYPLWYDGKEFTVGTKCPLPKETIQRHALLTKYYIDSLIRMRPELVEFFPHVEMVGYRPFEYAEHEPETLLTYLEEHAQVFLIRREEELTKAEIPFAQIDKDLSRLQIQLREEAMKAFHISLELSPNQNE